jgi:nucleoside-diphosphate-sugar epimerase
VRVFLAGASGVIGVLLVPLLVDAGHTVAGMTRSPAKADGLRELGAEPVGTYGGSRVPPPPRIHVDEAARATVPLIEAPTGIVVVAEEE